MVKAAVGERARWTREEAYAYCTAVARAHYENFPVASRLVPRRLRPHVAAIYAYARAADDFADEAMHDGRRLEQLERWEERLDRCLAGEADHPVFVALGETIERFSLPAGPFRDLLDAFRQDCRVRRYASWDALLDYCRRSANPIGRLMLLLYGHADDARARHSDAICTGLQLTNFWQDVAVDLRNDRIYLPADDRLRFGVAEEDLRAGRLHEGLRALLLELLGRTRRFFEDGRPLLHELRGRLAIEIRLTWLGGNRILDRIEAAGCDVFHARPELTAGDKALLTAKAVLGRWASP
ncbi:MAG: squalene synthase HpnC [Acidobacteriia bacterium]|nr:squalene synthase HpnC [Terriglobia bacterium]